MSKRLTTSEFIEQACVIHGDRYDYSKVKYINAWHKVLIVCRKHGEFPQSPVIHKMGVGCPACGLDSISEKSIGTLENFIIESKKVHGDRYDYSKSIYMGANAKTIITCRIHGDFKQTPKNHTSNAQNCPECARLVRGPQVTRDDFISKCIATHGDKYNYSHVVYRGNKRNVEIGCSAHGWFNQLALSHIQGQGCPKCGVERRTQGKTKGTQRFIDEARLIHGDKYDYGKVEYKNKNQGVVIGCLVHGLFTQTPATHLLKKCGCPSCSRSIGEESVEKSLIELGVSFSRQVKFDGCKNVRCLPYDFGFEYRGKNYLIEFDGIQHDVAIEIFGGEKGFIDRKRKDEIKTRFADQNGYTLIRLKPEHLPNMTEVIAEALNEQDCSV